MPVTHPTGSPGVQEAAPPLRRLLPGRRRELTDWHPEDPAFWQAGGAGIARRNLLWSVVAEHVGFSVWSLWSVLVLFLGPEYGVDPAGKFLLTALPTALGALLRVPYARAVAVFGGRTWTVVSALLLLVPTVATAVVLEPGTPYGTLLLTACLAGVGGGNFASSMANINAYYPQALKGWALGVNAGGGNLGVPAVQLAGLAVLATAGAGHPRLLVLLYIPLVVAAAVCAYLRMDDLRVPRPPGRWGVLLRWRHTWLVSLLYVGTFGSFIGFSFAFGQVLQVQFADEFATPVSAAYLTFLGPLLGSLVRPVGGRLADRFGGARVSLAVFAAMAGGALLALAASRARSLPLFVTAFTVLFVLSGLGNGSTYKMIPTLCRATPEGEARASALIGFAGAVGAFGGVLVNIAFRESFLAVGNGDGAYVAFVAAYVVCAGVTWTAYVRRSA
ncbi:MFS transporter [Streptomyces griseoluteus]|jgi:MFS transporter, NNP family, nitrate/nitrite transporter|uniref:MFS transporter n=1 Tax=Streptomyces griseoluteus TaxID=29306 RepID=UPI003802A2AE